MEIDMDRYTNVRVPFQVKIRPLWDGNITIKVDKKSLKMLKSDHCGMEIQLIHFKF